MAHVEAFVDSGPALLPPPRPKLTRALDLWAIVNNAGILSICPDAWSEMEEHKRVLDVNLYGVIRTTHVR